VTEPALSRRAFAQARYLRSFLTVTETNPALNTLITRARSSTCPVKKWSQVVP